MSATARDDLYRLAGEEEAGGVEEAQDQSTGGSKTPSTKEDVKAALGEMQAQWEDDARQTELQEKQKQQEQQQQYLLQERKASFEAVQKTIADLRKEQPDLDDILNKPIFHDSIQVDLDQVASSKEIPLIIREIAANEEVQQKLIKARTERSRIKILSDLKTVVLTSGQSRNRNPAMANRTMSPYNPNDDVGISEMNSEEIKNLRGAYNLDN